jgi:hypothetical protein
MPVECAIVCEREDAGSKGRQCVGFAWLKVQGFHHDSSIRLSRGFADDARAAGALEEYQVATVGKLVVVANVANADTGPNGWRSIEILILIDVVGKKSHGNETVSIQCILDHPPVTRFENMERDNGVRKQDAIAKGKKGNRIQEIDRQNFSHGPHSLLVTRMITRTPFCGQ